MENRATQSDCQKTRHIAKRFNIDHCFDVALPGFVAVTLMLPILPSLAIWQMTKNQLPSYGPYVVGIVAIWVVGELVCALGSGVFYCVGFAIGRVAAWINSRMRESTEDWWQKKSDESNYVWLTRTADRRDTWWFGCPYIYAVLAGYFADQLAPFVPRYLPDVRLAVQSEISFRVRKIVPETSRARVKFLGGMSFTIAVVGIVYLIIGSNVVLASMSTRPIGALMIIAAIVLHAYALLLDRGLVRHALVTLYRDLMKNDADFSKRQRQINLEIAGERQSTMRLEAANS